MRRTPAVYHRCQPPAPGLPRSLTVQLISVLGRMSGVRTYVAFGLAVMLAHSKAYAGDCAPPTPECHLANGRKLLDSDPRAAAAELLASYRLDERTETLTLYATALSRDKQYARALETWQRIIIFRESEIESAKEAMRVTSVSKRKAARAAEAKAQEASEQAAAEIMKLWPNTAKVRVRLAPGQQYTVSAAGVELDISREVLVNANRDELTFTRTDGSAQKLVVEVPPGQTKTIDAPKERGEKPAPMPEPTPAPAPAPMPAPMTEEPTPSVVSTKPALVMRTTGGPRSRTMSRVGLGLAAGGVVAIGVASTFALLANRDFDRAQDLGCNSDGDCPVGPAANAGDQARDRTRVAQITAIGGGALLVTGATLWILGRGKTHRESSEMTVSVGTNSLSLGWSLK